MTRLYWIGLWLLVMMIPTAGPADEVVGKRPAEWAEPMTLPGVPNLHKVSRNLFRSAQPTAEGMRHLKTNGVVTVVNLRSFHSDGSKIKGTGLKQERLYVKAWHPERDEAVRFLKIVTDPKRAPVLVHCQHGADRTGTMCALYRIVVQGWTKEAALREMTHGGFGYHSLWKNLPPWIEKLDVGALRKEAGITTANQRTAGNGFTENSQTLP